MKGDRVDKGIWVALAVFWMSCLCFFAIAMACPGSNGDPRTPGEVVQDVWDDMRGQYDPWEDW